MIPLTCDQRINVSENKSNHSLNQRFPGELLRLILFLRVGYSFNYCSLLHPRKSEILAAFGTGGLWGAGRGCSSVCYRQHRDRPSWWWGDTFLQILFGLNIEQRRARCFQSGPVKRWIKSLFLSQSLNLRVSHYVWDCLLPFLNWIFFFSILEHCIFNLFLKCLCNFFAFNFEAYVNWHKYCSSYECNISLILQPLICDPGPQKQ